MSADLILLLVGIGFFVAVIGIVIIIIHSTSHKSKPKAKKKKKIETIETDDTFDLDDLLDMAKDRKASANDLMNILIYFNTNFKITEENAKKALVFFSRILTHPNKDKSIFQYFHREVKPKNRGYTHQLNRIEKKALS